MDNGDYPSNGGPEGAGRGSGPDWGIAPLGRHVGGRRRPWNACVCVCVCACVPPLQVARRWPVESVTTCRALRPSRRPLVIDFDGGSGVRVGLDIRSHHRRSVTVTFLRWCERMPVRARCGASRARRSVSAARRRGVVGATACCGSARGRRCGTVDGSVCGTMCSACVDGLCRPCFRPLLTRSSVTPIIYIMLSSGFRTASPASRSSARWP
jgi:hypothetical protein